MEPLDRATLSVAVDGQAPCSGGHRDRHGRFPGSTSADRLVPGARRNVMLTVNFLAEARCEAVGDARRRLVELLRTAGLDLDDETAETLKLLLGELLANGIMHGYGGAAATPGASLPVRAQMDGGMLLVAVHDPGPGVPVERAASAAETNGRGLTLVARFSAGYGWRNSEMDDEGPGKWVWFKLDLNAPTLGAPTYLETEEVPGARMAAERRARTDLQSAALDAYRHALLLRPSPVVHTAAPCQGRPARTVRIGRAA
ncbi:ATP-binding protein [Kitasatospora sp. NPDC056138]|uniref:ATP-binding protein n=1 Tax=Kitasatospora sp. NPDC056138 TaxID=3345724 RepID=UPI0035D698C8